MPYIPSEIPSFKKITSQFARMATNTAEIEILGFAEAHAHRLRNRILVQEFESFKLIPLSPKYLQYKIDHGLDRRVMVATGHYVSRIGVHVEKTNKGKRYYIGFDPEESARTADGEEAQIKLVEVAYVQEYGSDRAHIPARPHWKPFFLNVLLPDSRLLGKKIARIVMHDLARIKAKQGR